MANVLQLLVTLHVAANMAWIGSISAVGVTLSARHGSSRDRGALALTVYRWLAVPSFIASLTLGMVRLVLSLDFYFVQTKFMHGKLLLAVVVIALHHVLGGVAKRMASGKVEAADHSSKLAAVLLICAVITVYFAVMKPF